MLGAFGEIGCNPKCIASSLLSGRKKGKKKQGIRKRTRLNSFILLEVKVVFIYCLHLVVVVVNEGMVSVE